MTETNDLTQVQLQVPVNLTGVTYRSVGNLSAATPLKKKISQQPLVASCLVDSYVLNKAFQALKLSVLVRGYLVPTIKQWPCISC